MELLFLKDKLGESTSQYKEGVYAKLLASYDVRMVFDDMKENLQAAVSQGITGVYPSIQDYTRYQVKSNPHAFYSSIVDDKGYPKEDPDEEPYQSYRSHADESGMGRTGYSAKRKILTPFDAPPSPPLPPPPPMPESSPEPMPESSPEPMPESSPEPMPMRKILIPFDAPPSPPPDFPPLPQRVQSDRKNPPLNCGCGKSPCMTFGGLKNPGDIQSRVESILIKEGGAAGLKPLKAAFPEGTTKKQATAAIAKMDTIRLHKHGDYILKNPLNIRDDANPDYYLCQSCGHEADPVEYAEIRSDPSLNIGGTSPICPYCGNQNAYEPRYHWQDEGHTMAPLSFKNPEEYSEDYMVPRDIHRLGKAADSLDDTYDEGQEVPEWWKSKLSVTAKDADTLADSLDYVANNPAALPIMSGEPSGKHTKLGAVFSEVFIGRNVIKDVGEGIQSIYRGLIGGRTSMAERRMAMAVATMQKELSDRAKALGGNAIANLKVDYELPGAASITIIASADAIKMPRPPKKNPNYSIDEDFERMKKMAYDVRTREVAGEPINGREWWNQQSSWIEERYGTEPLDVTWAMPLNTEGFDPQDKSQEFDDNGVKPLHFLNQLKRIPMTKQPTPERIMQIALNIGQGQASGSVETDFTLDDFIIRQNPLPLMGLSVQVTGHRNAAGAFVMKGKKFLILQRSKKETSKHGLWELPGGKVEKGETPRQTAVIETKEEAGLDIKLKANLGPHHDNKKKKTYHAYTGVAKKGQKSQTLLRNTLLTSG